MGDNDLLHGEVMPLQDGQYFLDVVARVNDHGLVRLLVTHDGAVTLQRAHGKNFVDHVFKLSWPEAGRRVLSDLYRGGLCAKLRQPVVNLGFILGTTRRSIPWIAFPS